LVLLKNWTKVKRLRFLSNTLTAFLKGFNAVTPAKDQTVKQYSMNMGKKSYNEDSIQQRQL